MLSLLSWVVELIIMNVLGVWLTPLSGGCLCYLGIPMGGFNVIRFMRLYSFGMIFLFCPSKYAFFFSLVTFSLSLFYFSLFAFSMLLMVWFTHEYDCIY